jgi:hypothetical protein
MEAFAREVAMTGRKPVEIYLEIYETNNRANARKRSYELMQRDDIQGRIAFLVNLQAKEEVKGVIADRHWIEREMIDLYMNARKNGDRTNAVKALQLMGQDIGMYVQRKAVLHGKMEPLEGDPSDVVRRISAQIARSFPGADPGAILGYLSAGTADGRARATEASETPAVQAVPEADGVSSSWEPLPKAVPDGGEPGREDAGCQLRDELPPDGPLS